MGSGMKKGIQFIFFILGYLIIDGYLTNMLGIQHMGELYLFEFVGIVILIIILPSVKKHTLNIIKPSILKERSTYYMVIGWLIFLYLFREIIFSINFLFDERFLFYYENDYLIGESFLYLLSAILLVPIYEEIIYRGMLQHWLSCKLHPIFGIVISSLVFGMIHGDYQMFGFIMGLSFGIMYHFKKSLIASILLHILWNLTSSLL